MDALTRTGGTWLYVFDGDASSFTDFTWSVGKKGPAVRFVRGTRMVDPEAMFEEWAAALQFPYYFGGNWAAFDECLADLSWIRGPGIVIAILDGSECLPDEEDWRLFLKKMAALSSAWAQQRQYNDAQAFKVVFQADNADELKARLAAAGYAAETIASAP